MCKKRKQYLDTVYKVVSETEGRRQNRKCWCMFEYTVLGLLYFCVHKRARLGLG